MTTVQQILQEVQELFNANEGEKATNLLVQKCRDLTLNNAARSYFYHLAGRTCYYRGEREEARRLFLESLTLDPSDDYSKLYLGLIEEQAGNTYTALRLYGEIYKQTPPFVHIAGRISRLLRALPVQDQRLGNILESETGKNGACTQPRFSILVLCYNKAEYTLRCLEALLRNTEYPNYEVIVVDNASVDITPAMLEAYGERITFVHSPRNLGFVGGNNLAAQYATGEFIVFLNNDTEVQPGWLTELYECYVCHPRAGAVGSMLIYPNGVLQEAGGVIFQDASGWNYGRGQSPASPRFQFVREVDYCSGAALSIRADLFRRLGGFDERYGPAYYEDTDLCFSVRKLGYKVLYCPFSKVIHHEGATSGTDLATGFKRYQVLNAPKFREKWQKELALQHPNDEQLRYLFSNRTRGKRIIIIDDFPPLPDRAAGSLRMYQTVRQMLALGCSVTYVHLTRRSLDEAALRHMEDLRRAGVELIWFEYEAWWEIRDTSVARIITERLIARLELPLRRPDLVYICFWHIADHFIDHLRKAIPSVPIVVDSMDLHFVREMRRAELSPDSGEKQLVQRNKKNELAVYAKADAVTTVTEADREMLRRELPDKAVFIMTDVHDPVEIRCSFDERRDLLFVGNFNHDPNEDAVVFFAEKIFPLIRKELPEVRFWVVGNNPTAKVKALASESIIVTGWVPETRPYLEQCRVAVVPLRYGAGNKGKVGEALAHGVPIVSTSIGAEGMDLVHGEHLFIADKPAEFARRVVELYADRTTWEKFSSAGQQFVQKYYSSALMRQRVQYIMSFARRESFTSYRAVRYSSPPRVSIIVLTHNQYPYTRQCLESIRNFTDVSHETIVVDNASSDGTPERIEREFPEVRLIRNEENLGFPGGVNQGINAAVGEHVVLLNNDTVVTKGWLERMLEIADSDSRIGLVGTVSNYASGIQRDPQAVYKTLEEMHRYACEVRESRRGEVIEFPRVAFLCTLVTRKALDVVGGLDERFTPGNYEDDDYCLRAALAGFKTVIARDVFIHHFGSKSFLAQGKDNYLARLETNRLVFKEKWNVDPDTLWTNSAALNVRRRSVKIPLHRDRFVQVFEQAQILIGEQDLAHALPALEDAIKAYHACEREGSVVEYVDLLNLAGNVALALGRLEEARRSFEEELKLTPTSARACVGLAETFYHAGFEQEAKTMFEFAAVYDSNDEIAREGLARVNRSLGLPYDHNTLLEGAEQSNGAQEALVTEEGSHV